MVDRNKYNTRHIEDYINYSQQGQLDFSIDEFKKLINDESKNNKLRNIKYRVEKIKQLLAYSIHDWSIVKSIIIDKPQNKLYNELRYTIFIFLVYIYRIDEWEQKEEVVSTLLSFLNKAENNTCSVLMEFGYFFGFEVINNHPELENKIVSIAQFHPNRFSRMGALYSLYYFYKENENRKLGYKFLISISKNDKSQEVRICAKILSDSLKG